MNLQIRDPRARLLADRLAKRRNISMTEAVIEALEAELARSGESIPLAERLAVIAEDLAAQAHPDGREMDRQEIDAMWGHS